MNNKVFSWKRIVTAVAVIFVAAFVAYVFGVRAVGDVNVFAVLQSVGDYTDYEKARNLSEAVQMLQSRVPKEYRPLLTEEKIRAAIPVALRKYGRIHREEGKKEHLRYFEQVKEIYTKISDKGTWPKGAYFQCFDTMGGKGVSHDGLWVHLEIPFEMKKFGQVGYALPILEVSYGGSAYTN